MKSAKTTSGLPWSKTPPRILCLAFASTFLSSSHFPMSSQSFYTGLPALTIEQSQAPLELCAEPAWLFPSCVSGQVCLFDSWVLCHLKLEDSGGRVYCVLNTTEEDTQHVTDPSHWFLFLLTTSTEATDCEGSSEVS